MHAKAKAELASRVCVLQTGPFKKGLTRGISRGISRGILPIKPKIAPIRDIPLGAQVVCLLGQSQVPVMVRLARYSYLVIVSVGSCVYVFPIVLCGRMKVIA